MKPLLNTAFGFVLASTLHAQSFDVTPTGVAYGNSGTRTEWKHDTGQMGGRSGFFETSAPAPAANWYPGASEWQHVIEARHSNTGNNFALQIAGSFFDQNLWFRKTSNNPSQPWSKIVTQSPAGSVTVSSGNGDALNIYNPADNAIALQTTLDGQPLNGYGGDVHNRLLLQPITGNVGIGTYGPTHKLTVNGQVRSKGFITDTSNWSDYVFAEDYKLTSLHEVEAHIKEKRHLPGVPSEAEVVSNGLDLGKMSAIQMAKIEELMLHVIALNKSLEAQSNQVKAQAEEIRLLKSARNGQ